MDNFREKGSKVAGIADRSSGGRFFSTGRTSRGNKKVQKQRNSLKLASESTSCSSRATDENSFTFEPGWRYLNQAIGTPMKKLLAEEMSGEIEYKRRSPSVIARLMGLDGLPPQQPAHKQQKKPSENYTKRTTSVEKAPKSGSAYDHRSSRRNSKEQAEFKDVYEVLETSKIESSSRSSLGLTNSKVSDAEMAFIQQKFMDGKHLSRDQKLQYMKEYHNAIEVPGSSQDRLLKFLQQPDSLFTKHVHDLRGAPSQAHQGCIAAEELSGAHKYESGELGKSVRRTLRSPQNHCDGLFAYPDCRYANALNSTKNPFERKDELAPIPTSIVVLKPNIGKAKNGTSCNSSPCSSHASLSDCRVHTEFPSSKNRKGDLSGANNVPDSVGLSSYKSRESRELAREITNKMRNSFRSGSMKISSAGFGGYAGDESSCDMSGNESEAITVESRNSFDLSNRYKPSSYHMAESSVSKEAKKRLSERWKMTIKSQEQGVVSKGSTLAEMLAIPDKYLMPEDLNGMIVGDKISDKFSSNDRSNGWVEPLGISSRDGWMDGSIRKLSRSRSLPASSSAFGSPKTSLHSETFYDKTCLMPKEASRKEKSKRIKGNSDGRHGPAPRKSRSSKKKHSASCTVRESKDCLVEVHTSQNQVEANFERIDPSEKDVMIFESLVSFDNHASPVSKNVGEVREETIAMPSETPGELLPEISGGKCGKDDICAGGQDILVTREPTMVSFEEGSVSLLHPLPGLESPISSKEADQPSPVSVMEAPFTDDLSSCSECFESLSADLHGLRMQLQLLKLESEAFAEGPTLISCDEDVDVGSVLNEKRVCGTEESWQHTYIIDVLNDSGFNDCDPHTFTAVWHSSECPVDPIVFEELEKKYHGRMSCARSERRLLFDRINSALLEIHQQFMGSHPWVRSATMGGSKWIKDGFQDRFSVLLAEQDKKSNEDILGNFLARESWWLGSGDGIDVIGREIERLLTDELIAEFLNL